VIVQPALQEVAGRYELSLNDFGPAVDKQIALLSPPPSIELKADGTVIVSNLPVIADDIHRNFTCSEFRTGTGTFQIVKNGYEKKSGVVTDFYGCSCCAAFFPSPSTVPASAGRALRWPLVGRTFSMVTFRSEWFL
jgi:hypothetical protein